MDHTEAIAHIQEDVSEIKRDITRIHKDMYEGNGEKSIRQQCRDHKEGLDGLVVCVKSVESATAHNRKLIKSCMLLTVSAALAGPNFPEILGLVANAWALLKHVIF